MPLPIAPIQIPTATTDISGSIQAPGIAGNSGEFRGLLEGAIQKVEQTGQVATQAVERFLSGDGQELHSAILAVQRADLAFELGLQVRNKVVSAYQEIMRIQM
jgi:flagellar hook-basal body complex protein FliE